MRKRLAALVGVVVLIGALSPAAAVAAKPHTHKPAEVRTSRDGAKDKIHPKLRKLIDAGSTANVYVFATVAGDPKAAGAMLGNVHVATTPNKEASLVIGRAKPQQLVKLAGLPSVISIRPIELTKSGSPLSDPDPDVGDAGPSNAALKGIFKQLKGKEVPYDKAPPLKTTNFEQLKQLALLDARTHRFAEAWQAGYAGEGSVVSVLDGGTDFGHPDMIGTWQTRPSTGWPNALDPFDSLVLAVQPGNVDLGLTWYTKTEAKSSFTQSVQDKKKGIVNVSFAVRRGPSRNFAAPDWDRHPHLHVPRRLVEVRHRPPRQPPRRLPARPLRRAAGVPRDRPAHGGRLRHDLRRPQRRLQLRRREAGHQGVAGVLARPGRRRLRRPLRRPGLLHLRRHRPTVTPVPGGPTTSASSITRAPGRARRLDRRLRPGIEGHGTLTASQRRRPGRHQRQPADVQRPPRRQVPGAVVGGAPHAKLAPFGDIYFSFDFSTQFAYLLPNQHAASTSRRTPTATPTSTTTASTRPARRPTSGHTAFGGRTTPIFSSGNGAPGFGTTTPPAPVTGDQGRRLDAVRRAPAGTRSRTYSQVTDNDVIELVRPRAGRDRQHRHRPRRRRRLLARVDATLDTASNGQDAWETWGGTSRSTPVAAGADRARLPGLPQDAPGRSRRLLRDAPASS